MKGFKENITVDKYLAFHIDVVADVVFIFYTDEIRFPKM